MSTQVIACIKISLAMAIVGSSVVIGKLVTASFPIFLASELRFLIATIIPVSLLYYKEKQIPLISKKYMFVLFYRGFSL